MSERKLKLTPINPFTKRQGEIIELTAAGYSHKEISSKLRVKVQTIKAHISGERAGLGCPGILDRIEKATGRRPLGKGWVSPLIGDVLVFRDED